MDGTILFVNQFVREEDKLLSLNNLIERFKTSKEERYMAEIYNRMKCNIKIINDKFPSIDLETKNSKALYNVYQAIEKYDEKVGSFNTLFCRIHNSDLVNELNYNLTLKNKANKNALYLYDKDDDDEVSLIDRLSSIDNSFTNINYRQSIINDSRLTDKEKKLCLFIIDTDGNVKEQKDYMNLSVPTINKMKRNIQKTLLNF